MNREEIITTLRAHEQQLRQRGVLHVGLFGSVARNEASPTSDIDILIELAPDARIDLFEYVSITQYLSDLLLNRVDVANRRRLKRWAAWLARRMAQPLLAMPRGRTPKRAGGIQPKSGSWSGV